MTKEDQVETPALDELMNGYFHQDWQLDGSTGDVVNLFLEWEPQTARALPEEIDAVLDAVSDEDSLGDLLRSKGCQYWADPVAGGYRSWLQAIARQARAHFAKPA